MRKWLDTFGPDKAEFLFLATAMAVIVIAYGAYLVHLYRVGGDVEGSLVAFAVAFALSGIARGSR